MNMMQNVHTANRGKNETIRVPVVSQLFVLF